MRAFPPAAAAAAAMVLAACSGAAPAAPAAPALPAHQAARAAAAVRKPGILLGVYEPDNPGSYGQVGKFAAATGVQPSLVVYYSPWGTPFATAFARQVHEHGGRPLVQAEPRGVSLAGITQGTQDGYLRAYARQVRGYGHPVVISFGQEMNGPWYPWGARLTTAAVFVAAWRHVVRLFRAEGARNVIWLWDVNCNFPGARPDRDWWPGSGYVTWAGVDCYYIKPDSTFASRFGSAVTEIRRFTSVPLLVAETAVGPRTGNVPGKIADLFASVKADHLLGVVWFDEAQRDGLYHQDWRLEGNPAGLAAFRRATATMRG